MYLIIKTIIYLYFYNYTHYIYVYIGKVLLDSLTYNNTYITNRSYVFT